jgi:hypothetical protein
MPEFTSRWLETEETPSQGPDNTDKRPFVSVVRATERPKQPYQEADESDDLSAFITALPAVETWNLDETVAHIRQLSHDERVVFLAALTHDWTAWKLAMADPNGNEL